LPEPDQIARRKAVWAALAIIYVVWGSTYLGIKLTSATLPPLFAASARFLIAGTILGFMAATVGRLDGRLPSRRQWLNAAISGALLMGGGNAGVVFAVQRIDTGMTALIVSLSPLVIGLFLLLFFRDRLPGRAWVGLALGVGGLALLIQPRGGPLDPIGVACALASVVLWAGGSVLASRTDMPKRWMLGSAAQMIAGGLVIGLESLASGELSRFHLEKVSWLSVAALAYLIVFGSVVAFSAFSWLLRVVPVSLAATAAYVNPVVAVILGAVVLGERITLREAIAGAVIIAAVVLIVTASTGGQRAPAAKVPPEPG
jgi:drug/metabolite transporter (DMT)-like permease